MPEVVYQRVVVQVGSTCNLAELANPRGGRFRARGTCVRVLIFVRMEGNSSVDRARGGVSESCRTTRLHLQLSRVGEFCAVKGFKHVLTVDSRGWLKRAKFARRRPVTTFEAER